jgi:hypothetical protein
MMRSRLLGACLFAAAATPLAAQTSPSLDRLAFMSGCWQGPYTSRRGTGTIEERYTPPSANVILGTTRYTVAGRTTDYEFNLIQLDSTGIALIPFPNGERSPHPFRLRLAGDTAFFEAPEHDYPKRVSYRRGADGSLVARIDSGAADTNPGEWRMSSVACTPGIAAPPFAAGTPGPVAPDRSGQGRLYIWETLNGLWLGLAVPAMLGADGSTAFGFGLLLGPATGILFAKAVNDARPVSVGQATAITWGGWWGWWTALGVTSLTGNSDDKTFWRNTALGMVGGTAVGLVLARNPITAGDASLVAHASAWGTFYGAAVAALVNANDAWPYVLVGGNAALIAGALATKNVELSAGRVWISTAAGIAGLVAGFGIDLIVQPNDANAAILIPAATSFAGLALGLSATRNMDRTRVGLGGPGPTPALLGMRDGRLQFGLPAPTPALVPRNDGARYRLVPGMRFTLFELRH